MIRIVFETDVGAPLSAIWQHYVDQDLRKQWETDLESISYDGPVATGTRGIMKLSGMPPIPFLLSRIEEGREFTDMVDIPDMGPLEFKHELCAVDGGNHVRQTVTFTSVSGETGGKEHDFFREVTKDIAETVFRLKSVVRGAGEKS